MSGQRRWPKPRAKREVRRGRRHGRSGARKRITVFLRAPLLKKVSRVLAAHDQTLEAGLEEALGEWLEKRKLDEEAAGSGS